MANIFRVTISQLLFSQTVQNVLHFRGPSSDPLQLSVLADEVQANWVTQARAVQFLPLKYVDIGVRLLESQFPTFHKTINMDATGGGTDQQVPFVCMVWRLRGNVIGRHGRGRVYMSGASNFEGHNGIIDANVITARRTRQDNILAWCGPNGSSTFRLVICPSKPPFNVVDVTSMDVNPVWCTQRRRNIGIGI